MCSNFWLAPKEVVVRMSSTNADRRLTTAMAELTEELSITLLEQIRWPKGLVCPQCAEHRVTKFKARNRRGMRRLYQCAECRYQYSVTVGTLFHSSHVPLNKWFGVIWLLSNQKKQPTVQAMRIILNLPYKTLWKMARKISNKRTEEKIELKSYLGIPAVNPDEPMEPQGSRPLAGQIGLEGIEILKIRLRRILGPPE